MHDATIAEEELSSSNLVTEARRQSTNRDVSEGEELTARGSPIRQRRNIKVNIYTRNMDVHSITSTPASRAGGSGPDRELLNPGGPSARNATLKSRAGAKTKYEQFYCSIEKVMEQNQQIREQQQF